MRCLFLGVGAVGGYYGGRLAAAGGDVTFLVRPKRRAMLEASGLNIVSPLGDLSIAPKLIAAGESAAPFDLVVLTCKAYDLDAAARDIAGHMSESTLLLPLLNGIAHLDYLQDRFGETRVLGGAVHIGSTLREDGAILHMNELNDIRLGRLDGSDCPLCDEFAAGFASTGVRAIHTREAVQAMWEKYVFLATLAAATCLMRASVGTILATGAGRGLMEGLLAEVTAIAASEGHPPGEKAAAAARKALLDEDSTFTASMMRDIEQGSETEGDHILGHLVRTARRNAIDAPLLSIAESHVDAYRIRRSACMLPR